jgi:hypothetical protein
MKRICVLLAIAMLAGSFLAALDLPLPFGGGGIPVYDSTAYLEALTQTAKLVAQITALTAIYNKITDQYNHMVHQAKFIQTLYRYRIPSTVWRGFSGNDTYGKLRAWIYAVNTGIDAAEGWENATIRNAVYAGGLAGVPASQQERKQTDYATIELQDGAAVSAMDTIGRIRLNGPGVESVLGQLETDSLSADPELQTEAAQLNKANAIALIQTRAVTDQNKLLVTNAEIALLRLKQEHDAAAYALGNDAAFRLAGREVLRAQQSGASEAMLAYRLP